MDPKRVIEQAIKHAKKSGFKIICGYNGSAKSRVICPLAALVWQERKRIPLKQGSLSKLAGSILETRPNNAEAFICGFDGQTVCSTFEYGWTWTEGDTVLTGAALKEAKVWYRLGKEFRAKYQPTNMSS